VFRHVASLYVKSTTAVICFVFMCVVILCGVFAPAIAPNDPIEINLEARLAQPSRTYPLGTDDQGRCVLSRLMYGARTSLGSAFIVMAVSLVIGTSFGAFAAYKGGRVDDVLMRAFDVFLAFPSLVVVLVIVGVLGPGLTNVMLGMISFQWLWYVRIVRSMVLSIKARSFVDAAKVAGTSDLRIVTNHIMPNLVPQLIVLATLDFGGLILHFAGYSFLGFGIQPPTPEWGVMIEDGRRFIRSSPQLMYYPGLMITAVVISLNLIGDKLRDIFDGMAPQEGA
jgi:nickel transport system permease protein